MENITDQFRSLLPRGIYVAIGDIGTSRSEDVLSKAEQDEYNTFNSRRRRDEYLSTRGIIKQLAAEMGLDKSKFEIQKDGLGKPFGIHNNQRYNLSLAHTGEKVLCGLSETIPIGLDLEPVDRQVNQRLRKRILHRDERKALEEEPVVRLWTLKEALVKLNGQGLRTNLNQLKIEPESDHLFTGIFDNEKSARICSFQYSNHWIAVACYYNHQ